MNKILIGILVFVGVCVFWLMGSYNGLVGMNEGVNGKWAQVENQLQRRYDLIPNLVESVKGYAAHETGAIQAVADARAKLGGAKTPETAAAANGELNGALSRLLVVVENYPNLKADANFRQLMEAYQNLQITDDKSLATFLDLLFAVSQTSQGLARLANIWLPYRHFDSPAAPALEIDEASVAAIMEQLERDDMDAPE